MPLSEIRAETRPWYREPWVWLLISIPGSAVVMGVVMVTLAVESYDGLVVDDYYKRGLEINQSLARDRLAAKLAIHVKLEMANGRLSMVVTAGEGPVPELDSLELSFYHATRKGFDHRVALRRISDQDFTGEAPELATGLWRVQVETPSWRLSRSVKSPLEHPLVLGGPWQGVTAVSPSRAE